ncbi:hypothetical protein [Pseudomonas serbica]
MQLGISPRTLQDWEQGDDSQADLAEPYCCSGLTNMLNMVLELFRLSVNVIPKCWSTGGRRVTKGSERV